MAISLEAGSPARYRRACGIPPDGSGPKNWNAQIVYLTTGSKSATINARQLLSARQQRSLAQMEAEQLQVQQQPVRLLSEAERNDLRKKVLRGERLSLE